MVMLATWFDEWLQALCLGGDRAEVVRVAADELALPAFAALLLAIFVVPAAHGAARILALTAILAVIAHAAISLARNLRATRESRTTRAAMSVAVEAIEGARRAANGLLETARAHVIPAMTKLNATAGTMATDRRLTASSRKRAAAIQASAAAALAALQTFVDPPATAAGPETLALALPEAATALALTDDAVSAEADGAPEGKALPAHLALVPVYRPVRPLRVLVAEADGIHQLMLRTLLAQAGIEPEVVAEGAEVVEAWRREPWDLILVDLELPGLNGRAAARMIRSVEAKMGWSFTPIVALADELTAHELADCVSLGIDRLVTRPITADALYRAIEASVAAPEEVALAQVA
jgi:CheY-like chemotaxis protein